MHAATLVPPISEFPPRKKFTRAEVEQMECAGLLEGQRVELIDGDLIDKMGQHPPHATAIRKILGLLTKYFLGELIQVQSPIEAGPSDQKWSLPEPDLALLLESKPEYGKRFPRGDELLLAIEVADSSVKHDATKKRDLYARAGVPEYWVIDIAGRKLIIHRHPVGGEYQVSTTLAESETASLEQRPDARFAVADMLP